MRKAISILSVAAATTVFLFSFIIIDDFSGSSGAIDASPRPTTFRGFAQGHLGSLGWRLDGQGLAYTPFSTVNKGEAMRSDYAYYPISGNEDVFNFGGVRFLDYTSYGIQDHGGVGFHWRDSYSDGFDGFWLYVAPASKNIVMEIAAGYTRPNTDHTYEHTYFIKANPCTNNPLAPTYGEWRDYRIVVQTVGNQTTLSFQIGVWPNFQYVQWSVGGLWKYYLTIDEILQNARRRNPLGDPDPCGNPLDGPSAAEDGLTPYFVWKPMYVMSNDYMNTDTFYHGY